MPVIKQHDDLALRKPQVKVLHALRPHSSDDSLIDWPTLTRVQLSLKAGCTAVSGTVGRALHGLRQGSKNGPPHPGLLARGMVEEMVFNIDGVSETSYRATRLGMEAYHAHLEKYGDAALQIKPRSKCVNKVHYEVNDKPLCGASGNRPPRVTDDLDKVTCGACIDAAGSPP